MNITFDNYESASNLEPSFRRSLNHFFGRQKAIDAKVAKGFCKFLDELEPLAPTQNMHYEKLNRIRVAADRVLSQTLNLPEGILLNRKIEALKIRLMGPDLDLPASSTLLGKAQQWKQDQLILDDKSLTHADVELLRESTRFLCFDNLLQTDDELREQFFDWTLRYHLSPYVFAAFPALKDKIIASGLHKDLSADHTSMLVVNRSTLDTMDVRIFQPGEFISLFSERGQDVLKDFENRHYRESRTTYFPSLNPLFGPQPKKGLQNWHPVIDTRRAALSSATWKDLPPVMRLSLEEASVYFGKNCNGSDWVISASASKGTIDPAIGSNHSYAEVGAPSEDGTYYNVYPIGRFPVDYPKGVFDYIKLLFHPHKATLLYPDPNPHYADRIHTRVSVVCSAEKGDRVFEWIRQECLESSDRLFFISSQNCAYWVQELFITHFKEEFDSTIFDGQFHDVKPGGKLDDFVEFLKKHPNIEKPFLAFLCFIMGGWVSQPETRNGHTRNVSLMDTAPWDKISVGYKLFDHPEASHKIARAGYVGLSSAAAAALPAEHAA